ncbi:ArpU family transcriptional regulator [Bacillus sp. TH13]|uniref:ArpU family transcriptional regulator n=1 Tax=Bacillus sp. TH13 TaxID=2796379 RepID=UPI001912F475|nr:ArpU family transcriptional regulator [Bacillus sp. TH13]MBK5492200.1 ArpU family transcriptional regulator [Bacillus sp. TH13]
MGQRQLIDEKEIRPYVIETLQDYRVLKVKYQNRQERTAFGVELLFPELRTNKEEENQDYLRYIQIKRTLDEALDEDQKSILEMKYMNIKSLNDDYIYTVLGLHKRTFYRKRKAAVLSVAKALGMIS